jgi:hypothetical protein
MPREGFPRKRRASIVRFDSIRGAILERSGGISFIKTNG